MNTKTKIQILALALCITSAIHAKQESILLNYVEPTVVNSTYLDINGEASIAIAVLINDEGYVDDWIALRTNDKVLITAIKNVIGEWRFKPDTMDGEPSWSYRELVFHFEQRGSMITLSHLDAIMSFFKTLNDNHILVVPFRELDRIPAPVVMDKPILNTSLVKNHKGKTVKFEFFIDELGKVRMPIVKESEAGDQVTAILLESLLKWEFEPPVKHGRSVATKAVIPFLVK